MKAPRIAVVDRYEIGSSDVVVSFERDITDDEFQSFRERLMSVYHLTATFKSNERPWSGSHEARGITTDEEAIKWARYFVDKIGDDYIIVLFKNGKPLSLEEEPADVNYRCLTCFHQRRGQRPECFKPGSDCKIVEV